MPEPISRYTCNQKASAASAPKATKLAHDGLRTRSAIRRGCKRTPAVRHFVASLIVIFGLSVLAPEYARAEILCPDDTPALLSADPIFADAEGEKQRFEVDKDYIRRVSSVGFTSIWETSSAFEVTEEIYDALNVTTTLTFFNELREVEARLLCILQLVEAHHGAAHESYAMILNLTASVVQRQGRYAAAESMLQRSLAILDAAAGSEHVSKIRPLTLLGIGAQAQGNNEAAVKYHQGALDIIEKSIGSNHKDNEPWQALIRESSR